MESEILLTRMVKKQLERDLNIVTGVSFQKIHCDTAEKKYITLN